MERCLARFAGSFGFGMVRKCHLTSAIILLQSQNETFQSHLRQHNVYSLPNEYVMFVNLATILR